MISAISRNTCDVCFKIICRGCGWEPDDSQVLLIQKEILTACPECGWRPGDVLIAS